MSRQVNKVRLGLAVRQNGNFELLSSNVYDIWNITYSYDQEYLGGATLESLTGFKRGNPSAFRLNVSINLRNTDENNTNNIRTLLNQTSSRFDRNITESNVTTTLNPNQPTLIAVWADDTDSNISNAEVCNMTSAKMAVERELTIGNQIVTINLEGATLKKEIPKKIGTIYD
jgi:hypothetical protein